MTFRIQLKNQKSKQVALNNHQIIKNDVDEVMVQNYWKFPLGFLSISTIDWNRRVRYRRCIRHVRNRN